jgi:uncharacterized protein (TIGR00297 family)
LLTYSGGSGGRPLAPERERSGRTASQVLANGLWAAGGAVLIDLGLEPGWVILTAALAAAQADTWATEIGIRAGWRVRLITSGQVVSPGTSGGVSVAGTAGGAAGAAALSGLYLALGGNTGFAGAAFLGGTIGMLTDSVLGATLQGRYYCEHCAAHTEEATHTCGRPARRIRGVRWLDNDGVNLVATGVGALSALGFAVWI